MILKVGNKLVTFNNITNENELVGILSKSLKSFDIDFESDEKSFLKIKEEISNNGQLEEYNNQDILLKKYKVTIPVYSIINGVYQVKLHLEEFEEIPKISKIIIEGIELDVIKFSINKENLINNSTIINSTIINLVYKIENKKYKELNKILKEKGKYFNVLCPEISDNIIEMRYGGITWSEHDNYYKYETTLVERNYDEVKSNNKPFTYPQLNNVIEELSKNIIITKELVKILKNSNILSAEKEKEINERAENEWQQLIRLYNKVIDAEEEFLEK